LSRNRGGYIRPTVAKLALLALAAAGALAGCGGDGGDKTFEGDGFSFTYPGEWRKSDFDVQFGQPVTTDAFAPAEGADVLLVGVGHLNAPVTEQNIEGLSHEFAAQIDHQSRQLKGRITNGPSRTTVGGLPALSFGVSAVNKSGTRTQSRLILVFDGRTQYFLNCQYTPSGAEEMKSGCDLVVESFQVE
jgi:PsbP